MNDYRDYLYHHGIKGQKWGHRRAGWYPIAAFKASRGRKIEQGSGRNELTKNARTAYKNFDKLTDKEINDAINRFNKEQQLKSLADKEKSAVLDFYDKKVLRAAKLTLSTVSTLAALEKLLKS